MMTVATFGMLTLIANTKLFLPLAAALSAENAKVGFAFKERSG